jgi:hypothetical protein
MRWGHTNTVMALRAGMKLMQHKSPPRVCSFYGNGAGNACGYQENLNEINHKSQTSLNILLIFLKNISKLFCDRCRKLDTSCFLVLLNCHWGSKHFIATI